MPGVQIGNGAIIAAKSVITRDVEPYTIVGGNPALLIRQRFSDEIIQKLQALQWWDWSIEKIARYGTNLLQATPESLSALERV